MECAFSPLPSGTSCAPGSSSASKPSISISATSTRGAKSSKPAWCRKSWCSNPVFRPEMNGQKGPHDIYVHIGGIDIVRVDPETFYVLEDNARTPSGVSYPRNHAAALSGIVRPPPGGAGRELPGRTVGDLEVGCACDL